MSQDSLPMIEEQFPARLQQPSTTAPESLRALQEIVEALDRRVPQLERAGEDRIAEDAARLRADAIQRIAVLRNAISGWEDDGGAGQQRFRFPERCDA